MQEQRHGINSSIRHVLRPAGGIPIEPDLRGQIIIDRKAYCNSWVGWSAFPGDLICGALHHEGLAGIAVGRSELAKIFAASACQFALSIEQHFNQDAFFRAEAPSPQGGGNRRLLSINVHRLTKSAAGGSGAACNSSSIFDLMSSAGSVVDMEKVTGMDFLNLEGPLTFGVAIFRLLYLAAGTPLAWSH
jgi:hypothetical protein